MKQKTENQNISSVPKIETEMVTNVNRNEYPVHDERVRQSRLGDYGNEMNETNVAIEAS